MSLQIYDLKQCSLRCYKQIVQFVFFERLFHKQCRERVVRVVLTEKWIEIVKEIDHKVNEKISQFITG